MTDTVNIIIEGTTSTIPAEELTIERIIAEARSVGYQEFSVFCNEKEIKGPDDLKIIPGADYIVTPPETELNMDDIEFEVIEEADGNDTD
ncbi:MAG: hypothetical protein P8H57_05060 [Emcibacteraceae bacterium]|jgi:hypothetical protein|uniref:hypothetical protein n=1 Tax=Pseudemcibacter sp. TaxID=2943293 RepID=UPI00230CB28A|nr:hypothetical protein [Kordiimonadaceae bacterium]MDA9180305.1 hypothetical protein [Emcibacteraceae bacterium]MDA9553213.1 hypothetical protein [Emcibacteraceae bacterium]MDG1020176.1 hypothetical protein [Emcibacteraceae bacterium]MDG1726502.1 hypothetical protein [Emcibacteraceae bacterium]